MKAKTIKKVLKSKILSLSNYVDKWTSNSSENKDNVIYNDPELPSDILNGTIITGGCIISMLQKENPNDYDCYFKNRTLAMRVAKFFLWLYQHQNESEVDHFIVYRESGDETYNPDILHEEKYKGEGNIMVDGWRRHYSNAKNANHTPGSGRFKIVIISDGIASTQENEQKYEYLESRPNEIGKNWIDAITSTDEIANNTVEEEASKVLQEKHHPIFMSANAITLAGKIQLITRFFGEPEEIHGNYDFIHCTCSYKSWDNELELPQEALESLITKELRYVGSLYPLCSIIRIRKFVARGWSINAGQILRMVFQCGELDLNDINVLEDQLTGVDAAYFMQIITRLKECNAKKIIREMEENSLTQIQAIKKVGTRVDTSYLSTLIDRIF